jgi:hypothetical protein
MPNGHRLIVHAQKIGAFWDCAFQQIWWQVSVNTAGAGSMFLIEKTYNRKITWRGQSRRVDQQHISGQ